MTLTPLAKKAQAPAIDLEAEPEVYVPGKPINITWAIETPTLKTLGTVIRFYLPAGVTSPDKKISASIVTNGYYKFTPSSKKGSTSWIVSSNAVFPLIFRVELLSNSVVIAENSVVINEGVYTTNAKSNNSFSAQNGKVKVAVPADASEEALVFDVRYPSPNNLPSTSLTWNPVEIIAAGKTSGKNAHEFKKPITVELSYADDESVVGKEDTLSIYYFDETLNEWNPLETSVDTETKTIKAESNHLTVFDYKASYWQAASLPTVDSFKVATFTGAGTYDVNLWTPPGTAGLTPSLSLSYNSQILDESLTYAQASWVGLGWSLDTGAIIRNMHETTTVNDDTFSIAMSGFSGTLLPTSVNGTITTYHTTDESYNRIEFDSGADTWKIWDKSGTLYTFDKKARTHTTSGCTSSSANNNVTWKWGLGSITDTNDNSINFTYYLEPKSASCKNEIAIYPDTITYANNHYRIRFDRAARTDYLSTWSGSTYKILYGKYSLNKIIVEAMLPNTSTFTPIRQYQLGYANGGANQIFPYFDWNGTTAGGYTLSLTAVQELDGTGTAALPAVQFSYGDSMHLTKVNNGQGGTVEATYSPWYYFDDANKDLYNSYIKFGETECNPYSRNGTSWSAVLGSVACVYGSDPNAPNYSWLKVGANAAAVAKRTLPQNFMKMGAYYLDYVQVRASSGTTSLKWGVWDTSTNSMIMFDSVAKGITIGTTPVDMQDYFFMPANYDPGKVFQRMECSKCYFKYTQLVRMPTYYSVSSRIVTDAVTNTSTTMNYIYDNPMMTMSEVSDAVVSAGSSYATKLYYRINTDYRGNSMVQETNSESLTNVTWFAQDDALKGRPYHTLSMQRTFYDALDSINTSDWTKSAAGTFGNGGIQYRHLDRAASLTNASANWDVSLTRANASVTNGQTAVASIRLKTGVTGAKGEAGLLGSSGKFAGVQITPQGANWAIDTGGGIQTSPITGLGTVRLDSWYTVMVTPDSANGTRIRIWSQYDPSKYAETVVAGLPADTWMFRARSNSATFYLDAYFEGRVYSESLTQYTKSIDYDAIANNGITDIANTNLMGKYDLAIRTIRINDTQSRNYEGDSSFSGTRQVYDYNTADQNGTQYGNITRTTTQEWNGSAWVNHTATHTEYWPVFTGTKLLASLPARQTTIDCNPNCDFSGSSGILAESLNLYDGSAIYNASPSTGRLTATRTWMKTETGTKYYSETGYGYDAGGNVNAITAYPEYATVDSSPGGDARTTLRDYDPWYGAYLLTETNPAGHLTAIAYDYTLGVPISATDANNQTTTASYDTLGRMTKIVAPYDSSNSPTLAIAYYNYATGDPFHIVLSQKLDDNRTTQYVRYYDGTGKQIQTQTLGAQVSGATKNIVVDAIYDSLGRQIKQTVPYTYTGGMAYQGLHPANPGTATAYDTLGRATSQTEPNGNQTITQYGELQVSVQDALSRTSTTAYDVWGRPSQVTPPTGPGMIYAYDKLGRLLQVTKGSGGSASITQMGYDAGGRKTSMTDPDMGGWSYVYDAMGSLVSQTDARGCATTLSYDPLSRLTGKEYNPACPATDPVSYIYDDGYIGARTGMSDGSGSTGWTYDNRGRKLSETKHIFDESGINTQDFSTSWTYNSADLPVSITYPDGEVVNLGYNDQMLPKVMQSADATPYTYVKDTAYDEAGRMTSLQVGDTGGNAIITRAYQYYGWTTATKGGRLQSLVSTNAASANLQTLGYDYNAVGNILSIADGVSAENSSFAYDALNRLTGMTVSSGGQTVHSESFGYDAGTGSMASKNGQAMSYDPNHKHAVSGFNGTSYTYDANGNQVTRALTAGTFSLSYDAENHLVGMAPQGGMKMSQGMVLSGPGTATATATTEPTTTVTPTATVTPTETAIPQGGAPTATAEPTVTSTATQEPTVTSTASPEAASVELDNMVIEALSTENATLEPAPSETATPLGGAQTATTTVEATATETATPTSEITPTETATPTAETAAQKAMGMSALSGVESLSGAEYVYDGDGTMVKSIINGVSTYYPGRHYNLEVSGTTSVAQKTYAFGSMTIAVRTDGILKWVLSDHLGSTSITANEDGSLNSEIRYFAFGEVRYSSGTTPTDYQYTNQLNQADIGLYYYVARFYDPVIAHFVQADTIVPGAGNPAAYDRYSYVLNNPMNYNDPSGHTCSDDPSLPCVLRPGERAPYQSASNPIKYTIKYINPTATSGNSSTNNTGSVNQNRSSNSINTTQSNPQRLPTIENWKPTNKWEFADNLFFQAKAEGGYGFRFQGSSTTTLINNNLSLSVQQNLNIKSVQLPLFVSWDFNEQVINAGTQSNNNNIESQVAISINLKLGSIGVQSTTQVFNDNSRNGYFGYSDGYARIGLPSIIALGIGAVIYAQTGVFPNPIPLLATANK